MHSGFRSLGSANTGAAAAAARADSSTEGPFTAKVVGRSCGGIIVALVGIGMGGPCAAAAAGADKATAACCSTAAPCTVAFAALYYNTGAEAVASAGTAQCCEIRCAKGCRGEMGCCYFVRTCGSHCARDSYANACRCCNDAAAATACDFRCARAFRAAAAVLLSHQCWSSLVLHKPCQSRLLLLCLYHCRNCSLRKQLQRLRHSYCHQQVIVGSKLHQGAEGPITAAIRHVTCSAEYLCLDGDNPAAERK